MSGVKVGGVWKTPASAAVKVGGVWRTAATTSVKVGGVWRTTTLGSAPMPEITYVSTGIFEVSNTESTGVYTATLVSGSGTATPSTVAGKHRYTLSSANARFALTYQYAAGSPVSAADFMERKAYTYSCRTVPATCYNPCNCRNEGGNCYCVGPDPNTGGCPAGTSPNGQCGCGGGSPCMGGSIGTTVCDQCPYDCSYQVCDVLIDQPGYTNSGTEWYKVS